MWLTATAFISTLRYIVYAYGIAQHTDMSCHTLLSTHPSAIQPRHNLFKCLGWCLVCTVTCHWRDHKWHFCLNQHPSTPSPAELQSAGQLSTFREYQRLSSYVKLKMLSCNCGPMYSDWDIISEIYKKTWGECLFPWQNLLYERRKTPWSTHELICQGAILFLLLLQK